MKPAAHIVTSGALGLTLYAIKGDIAPALSCFFAGWLIDLDHIFDYVNNLGLRRGFMLILNVHNTFPGERFEEGIRDLIHVYIFLHSWELMIGFWALYLFYPIDPIITGVFLGFTLHVALDYVYYARKLKSPLVYFLTYRLLHRFKVAALSDL